jgi:hypothetical protein
MWSQLEAEEKEKASEPEKELLRRKLYGDLREAMGYDRNILGWHYAEYCGIKFEWELCDFFKIIKEDKDEQIDLEKLDDMELSDLVERVQTYKARSKK